MPPSTGTQATSPTLGSSKTPLSLPTPLPSQQHLSPEHAYNGLISPPLPSSRKVRKTSPLGIDAGASSSIANGNGSAGLRVDKRRSREASARAPKRGAWKKLLWVKQAYPDNYTDELQFLSHLQRNPTLRPYEFWPLVMDSTIIVQHVASVIIFICCFVGIFQERVSPVSVVVWATIGTVLGWVARDWWLGKDEENQREEALRTAADQPHTSKDLSGIAEEPGDNIDDSVSVLASGLTTPAVELDISFNMPPYTRSVSPARSYASLAHRDPPTRNLSFASDPLASLPEAAPPPDLRETHVSSRTADRIATAKSAILIYCALLGLSPILKSLTMSTSPDSIWAMSSWLMIINVFTFDYGAGVEAKFPAPLSTNAALMASTVLASRLPSTTHVFSLTLFSIEVFGLFPVFRRLLRHVSWTGHLALTAALIIGAGGGLCVVITGGAWIAAAVGVVLGSALTCVAMGLTSWWLIGLQRFKNEIRGPWDPARPVLRPRWD